MALNKILYILLSLTISLSVPKALSSLVPVPLALVVRLSSKNGYLVVRLSSKLISFSL